MVLTSPSICPFLVVAYKAAVGGGAYLAATSIKRTPASFLGRKSRRHACSRRDSGRADDRMYVSAGRSNHFQNHQARLCAGLFSFQARIFQWSISMTKHASGVVTAK